MNSSETLPKDGAIPNTTSSPPQAPTSKCDVRIVRCELLWGGGASHAKKETAFTPVHDCEIQPLVLLRDGNGRLFDDDELAAKTHPRFIIEVHYRWLTGPPRAVCYFHPHHDAHFQCAATLRCFCSYSCFLRGHKQLRKFYNSSGQYAIALHPNPHTYGVPTAKFPWDNYDSMREVDDRHYKLLKQANLLFDPLQMQWTPASLTRNFTPRQSEVGKQLKFEVVVIVRPREDSGPFPIDIDASRRTQSQKFLSGVNPISAEEVTRNNNNNSSNNLNTANYSNNKPAGHPRESFSDSRSYEGDLARPPQDAPMTSSEEVYASSTVRAQSLPHSALGHQNNNNTNKLPNKASVSASSTNNIKMPQAQQLSPSRISAPNSMESEEKFWREWDSKKSEIMANRIVITNGRKNENDSEANNEIIFSDEEGDKLHRFVMTACVVPQMPLAEKRDFVPAGILAIFTPGGTPSMRSQRLRMSGMLITDVVSAKQASMLAKSGAVLKKISEPIGAKFQFASGMGHLGVKGPHGGLSARRVKDKLNPHEKAIIESTREDFLTDGYTAVKQAVAQQEAAMRQAQAAASAHAQLSGMAQGGSMGRVRRSNNNVGLPPGIDPLDWAVKQDANSLSLMSWNVLAEIYATTDAFPYCDPYVLAWSYRRNRLLSEIVSANPDIVCLQEVQAEHFEDFFAPNMAQHGYEGLYKQKTVEIFTGTGKRAGGKFTCDGCATFFKVSRFRLLDNFGIEFSHLIESSLRSAPAYEHRHHSQHKALRRLLKDNVALVLLLETLPVMNDPSGQGGNVSDLGGVGSGRPDKGLLSMDAERGIFPDLNQPPHSFVTSRHLVVVNTHIVANPETPDVKLWQAQTLLNVVQDYMHELSMRMDFEFNRAYGPARPEIPSIGLVISGDFNSPPNSAVYELLTTGRCDIRHEEFSADRTGLLSDLAIGHRMPLRSAYGVANMLRKEAERAIQLHQIPAIQPIQTYEPEFTNYTRDFIGCLDYIFFNESLRVVATLDLLSELTLIEEAHLLQLSDWALPSPQRSSDHIPLVCKFSWNEPVPHGGKD